jgi:hypothetical protein
VLAPLLLAVASFAGAPTISLPGGAVDGQPLLGRTVPEVTAELGAASSVERYPHRRDLVYGPARRPRLEVIFHGPAANPSDQVAWAILAADPGTVVRGLGRVLAAPPVSLERTLETTGLREERRYRCDTRGCFGSFFSRDETRRVIYGLQHGARYLGVQVWPNPR